MTYPPQPPGPYGPQQPGGYGQQPGQNPQPGGYPQQPGGYPQTGGQPQQPGGYPQQQPGGYPQGAPGQPGGYPQTGGHPQSPPQQQPGGYPPPPGFGQPGAYGQQPGGFPPGYPAGGGPGKSKTPIILAGVGVVVVLVVIFVGGFVWPGFFTSSSSASPTDVANSFIAAAKADNLDAANTLLCTKLTPQQIQQQKKFDQQDPSQVTAASIVGSPTISGTTAKVTISLTQVDKGPDSSGKPQTANLTLNMQQVNGNWCISNQLGQGSNQPSQPAQPSMPSDFPTTGSDSSDNGFSDSGVPSEPDVPTSLPGDGGTG